MSTAVFRLAFAATLVAFWPVWRWYAAGIADGSNDPWGLLAGATALAVALHGGRRREVALPLVLPGAMVVAYIAASLLGVLPSIRAMLAFLALASLLSAWRLGRRLDTALAALLLLALPLAASLQFYFGYPLRALAGMLAATLLQLNGLAVVREGAVLAWEGRQIAIDVPCSGVKMLWAGAYLAAASAALYRLVAGRAVVAVLLALLLVVLANALRAAALFYLESGLIALPPWSHDAVGMAAFAAAGLAIVRCVKLIGTGISWPRHASALS